MLHRYFQWDGWWWKGFGQNYVNIECHVTSTSNYVFCLKTSQLFPKIGRCRFFYRLFYQYWVLRIFLMTIIVFLILFYLCKPCLSYLLFVGVWPHVYTHTYIHIHFNIKNLYFSLHFFKRLLRNIGLESTQNLCRKLCGRLNYSMWVWSATIIKLLNSAVNHPALNFVYSRKFNIQLSIKWPIQQ